MKAIVKLNDGEVITPTYEPTPERLVQLFTFYRQRYNAGQIMAYRIIIGENETFAGEGTL